MKKLYNIKIKDRSRIKGIAQLEGETIETKIKRITTNNEPITDGAPILYTERKDGVLPQTDIRADRWEYAIDAMDKVSKTHVAKRMERQQLKDGKTEPTQGTEGKQTA